MRHLVKKKKLSRPRDARRALIKSLLVSLIKSGQITTTLAKAKVLKAHMDHLISYAIKGDVGSRRQVLRVIPHREVVHKLFSEIASQFQKDNNIKGGYTRVLKLGRRRGDGASLAIVTIGAPQIKTPKPKEKETKK